MHIHTPAEKLTDLRVGSTVTVHSYGHLYTARVAEIKNNRARCVWTNKSGVKYDNWITIPGREEKDRNPVASESRKLKVQANQLDKRAGYQDDWAARQDKAAVGYIDQKVRIERAGLQAEIERLVAEDNEFTNRNRTAEQYAAHHWLFSRGVRRLTQQEVVDQLVEAAAQAAAAARRAREQAEELRAEAAALRVRADELRAGAKAS